MDPRILLATVSAAGAFLGAGVMIGLAPDTGTVAVPTGVLAEPTTSGPDVLDGAAPSPPTASGSVPADDPFAEAPAGNPFDGPPTDNPFGGEPGENPFAAPMPPGVKFPPSGAIPSGGPYPADVRGIGQLFRDRQAQVDECMNKQGPAASPGELAVMLRLHLGTDASGAGFVEKVEATQDTEGRYQYFLQCLQGAMSNANMGAPNNGKVVVHWSVRRMVVE